jgi:hypothetical protein
MTAEPAAATRHTATYPGRADQLRHVRRAVASHLAGCAAADAVLVASELAANAILHSRSRAGHFSVRTELHPDHVWIEAEDFGGPWRRRQPDGRPHGLDAVEALTGPDGWARRSPPAAAGSSGHASTWTRRTNEPACPPLSSL